MSRMLRRPWIKSAIENHLKDRPIVNKRKAAQVLEMPAGFLEETQTQMMTLGIVQCNSSRPTQVMKMPEFVIFYLGTVRPEIK